MPLLLTERDVRAVLPMPDLIDTMEKALAEYSAGRVVQPVRTVLDIGSEEAFFGVMPAALSDPPAVGAKFVTVFHRNYERGLQSHQACIVLVDHVTGVLLALLDGRYITEARTAAVSAVSCRHLARPDAGTLGILGTGVQARSHLEAIRHICTLRDVLVWSPTAAHRKGFAREMSETTGLRVRATNDPAGAVRTADIIVLATSSRVPVLASRDVSNGAHICAVGACRPDQREMPTDLVKRGRVYVDSRSAALKEAGDLLLPISQGAFDDHHIIGELGDLVNGRIAGRQERNEVTIFKSLGMAVEDVLAARLVVSRAQAQRLGQSFSLT